MEQINIDTKEIEIVYKPFFDYTKHLIVGLIRSETERLIQEIETKDFIESFDNVNNVHEFSKMNKENKLENMIQWFKEELWVLEEEIYDMAKDDFEFEIPE